MAGVSIPELASGQKWSGNTITYSFVSTFPPGYTDKEKADIGTPVSLSAAQRQVVIGILNDIQAITGITFVAVDPASAGQVGDITFGIGSAVGTGALINAQGFTIAPIGQAGPSGDVWIQQNLSASAFAFTALHEIGHALGLDHPMQRDDNPLRPTPPYLDTSEGYWSYSVMMAQESTNRYESLPQPSTFMLYDIAELQSLYGAGTGNAGDNTYTFGSTPVRMTIWDSGGTDTISAAAASNGALINLNETKFSSIINNTAFDPGYPANNIAIALGATIENAVGSSQADIIIGNKVANNLDGGAGNDLIFGDEVVAKQIIPDGSYRDWQIDGPLFWFKGAYQVDGTTNASDNDTISGGAGDDWLYGGAGDDAIRGGAGNDYLDGGAGTDTALYDDATGGQTLELHSGNAPDGVRPDGGGTFFAISRGSETDILHSIEKINLVGNDNTVVVKPIADLQSTNTTINLGATLYSSNDTLDFSQYGKNVYLGTQRSSDGKSDAAGLFNNENLTIFSGFSFTGMTALNLGSGDDTVKLSQAADPYLHTINTGGGKNTISSDNINVLINLQGSDDTVLHEGKGSVVNVGSGHATINISNDVLIVGAKPTDQIVTTGGTVLRGAVGQIGSESPWIVGSDNTSYSLDTNGELAIKDNQGNTTYIANYKGGSNDFSQQTAGIFIGLASVDVEKLLNLKRPYNENIPTTFKLAAQLYYTQTGKRLYPAGNDPLVFDLSGDGINLTGVSSAAPMFDGNHTGFAVHTGWFGENDGILVIDKNNNGEIDDVSEIVGGQGGGFAALAQDDANGDGVIDAKDPIYAQLQIWRDGNGDAKVDPGELMTLAQAGIASINVASTAVTGTSIAGNPLLATGSFTRTDGTSGAVDDMTFSTDPFNSVYKGDTSVSSAASALPNLKGFGTLTDLRVAMTIDPALATAGQAGAPPTLIDTINANLPNLNQIDLDALRTAALPIFEAWARAVPLPDANGDLEVVDPLAGHSDVAIQVQIDPGGESTVTDFAYWFTDTDGSSYFKLASGHDVKDAAGNVIDHPTFAQVEAQSGWTVLTAGEIGFTERYLGEPLPIDTTPDNPTAMLAAMQSFVTGAWTAMNLEAVRLAMQGPLASFFPGVIYDATTNQFSATSDLELSPMYAAIFAAAPADPAGTTAWLTQWKPIVDIVLGDFDRGEGRLVTYGYQFASMVRSYESSALPIGITQAAAALGVPADEIVDGGSSLTGATSSPNIFYLHGGDQTVTSTNTSVDNFVMGGTFGNDVIDADRGGSGLDDILRLTNVRSTDVTATRDGLDLILNVNGTNEQIRVVGEFIGIKPGLDGEGNLNDKMGVQQVVFSDGVVWDKPDISWAVSHPDPTHLSNLGTPDMDVIDPGLGGGHYLSGGDGGDIYIYGRGYGQDTIEDNQNWILQDAPDAVKFNPGITADDLQFYRDGDSNDLHVFINGTSDELTILDQFEVSYNIWTFELNRIEAFNFSDGTSLSWEDIIQTMDAQAKGPIIYGFDYDDTLDPGAGVHYLSGGNGNDTYVFDFGYAFDVVEDNQTRILSGSTNTIQFGPTVRPQDVSFARIGNSDDLAVTLSDGSTLWIKGEFRSGVATDLVQNFQFADGTLITYDQLRQQMLADTSGNDVILGSHAPEVLNGGAGNDYLAGESGSGDVFAFGHGFGHDTIDDVGGTVAFNADVSPSNVEWSKLGSDLIVKLKGSNDSLNILNEFDSTFIGGISIGTFQFADGTVLSRDDVYAQMMQGTAGNDGIDATNLNSITSLGHQPLHGGPGDDVLIGSGGDTIMFNAGDGRDAVADPAYKGANTIDFSTAITPDMVHIHQLGTSLVFTFDGTNDRIAYVDNQTYGFPIGSVVFADGTTWTTADIQARMEAGTSLTAVQTGGAYEYDYNLAQGYAVATPPSGQAATVTIRVSGILPADVDLQRVRFPDTYYDGGASILISAKDSTSGGLLIDNESANTLPFDQLVFDDGTVWTRAQVQQMLLDQAAQSTGNNIIYGFDGNDTITSGLGDDVLEGGNGNDTYVYRRGDGFDKIVVNKAPGSGYVDTLSLADIASTEVSLMRVPGKGINDLVIEIDGTNGSPQGQITIADEFNYGESSAFGYRSNPADAAIQQITFSDGVVWSEADIEAKLLVQEEAQASPGAAIYGFDGADTLVAGTSARTLVGGLGSDTYVWTAGDGPTWISDQGSVAVQHGFETNTFEIKGVNPSDVTVTRNPMPGSHDLILTMAGQNPIVLQDQTATGTTNVIQNVVFDDGTSWDASDLILKADGGIASTPDGVAARSFDGMAAGTILSGTTSNDVYFWGGGDGNDTITETVSPPWAKADALRLRDLNLGDVTLAIAANQPDELIIINNATGERLTVTGQFDRASTDGSNAVAGNGDGIERLIFADGTVLNAAQILDHAVYVASPGNNTVGNLGLGTGSIPMVASPGVTALRGVAGWSDTYVWKPGDGDVSIFDGGTTSSATDTLRLVGLASNAVSMLRSGPDLLIRTLSTGETITVDQEFSNTQGAGIERVVFDDGTVIDVQKLFGIIHAGLTATFEKGAGQVILTPTGDNITLQMAQDISPSDVILQSNAAGDLVVKLVDTGDSVTLMGDLTHSISGQTSSQFSTITFGDGSSWDLNGPLTFTWGGSAGNTTLTGSTFGSNVFDLGPGGDAVTAGTANDVFSFDKGDGQANVTLAGGGTLRLGADITASDVILQADAAGDLIVKLLDTGDSITLANDLWKNISGGTQSHVGAITFGDGTSIDLNQPLTFTWSGSVGNTVLTGSIYGSNVFDLGPGGDSVTASTSHDVFSFDKGDGQANVTLAGGGTLQLAADIAVSDVTVRVEAGDLTVKLLDTGDSITLLKDVGTTISGGMFGVVGAITFGDGTVVSIGQPTVGQGPPITFVWLGNSNNYTLTGSNYGSNEFDIAASNGTINFGNSSNGGDGKNTVEYAKGDGVANVSLNGGTGVISFGSNVSAQDVYLQESNGNLTLQFVGDATDRITIYSDLTYSSGTMTSGISQLNFSNGSAINLSQGSPPVFTWLGNSNNYSLTGSNYGSNVFNITANGGSINFGNSSKGGDGKNTVEYAKGDGVANVSLNGGTGVISFGSNVSAQDVYLQESNGNLTLQFVGDATDRITIYSDLTYSSGTMTSGISQLQFSDGSSINLSQGSPPVFTWLGNSSNYNLTGSNYGSNVFNITASNGSINFGNSSKGGYPHRRRKLGQEK